MPPRKVSIKLSPPKAMTRLPAATSSLKEELLKWICERHATNGPLDRQLLRDKALGLTTSLGVTGFKCSEAWLTLFLKKHGFSPSLTNCSGPTFPDYRVWIDLLRSLITQYRHKDLFNVDELRMYSDFVPARISSGSFHVRDHIERAPETSAGNHRSDWSSANRSPKTNRIGMLVCCNSSGTEKLRPLISGPYELEDPRRDFRYHRNEDSSITDDLFGEWLAALNEDMASSGRKILLLLSRDRIRSLHNAPRLSNVNLLFFPKDFPTQLRPLRGDVFHRVKMTHRSRYAERIRSAGGEWRPEEIVGSLARAWAEVPQELVVSSFQKTKFREDDSSLRIECPAWDRLGTGVSFRRFVTFDDDLSETSSGIPEDLQLSASNGHQYNLRRSRRDTDLVVIDEDKPSINPPRGKKASKRSAEEETGSQPVAATNGDRNSSGMRKKRKMAEEIVVEARQDGQQEFRASASSETRDRSLVERIEEFLESVADPSVEDDPVSETSGADRNHGNVHDLQNETSGADRNHENVDNLINEIWQRSGKTRNLMERCLRTITAGDGASGLNDEDARVARFQKGDPMEEIDSMQGKTELGEESRTGWDEESARTSAEAATSGQGATAEGTSGFRNPQLGEKSRTGRHEETVRNSAEAATSGPGATAEGSSGFENPPVVKEFDDGDEEIPIAGPLSLKIIEAIECCDEIEKSEALDINHLQAGDDCNDPRTAKRTRDVGDEDDEDDDGPARKRARPDGSWSKRYEKNFVFGPELRDSASQSVESSLDEPPAQSNGPATRSKMTQTRGGELEKRCIFTLDGDSPGVPYPKD